MIFGQGRKKTYSSCHGRRARQAALNKMDDLEVLALRELLLTAPEESMDVEMIALCNDRILKGTYVADKAVKRRMWETLMVQIGDEYEQAHTTSRHRTVRLVACVVCHPAYIKAFRLRKAT